MPVRKVLPLALCSLMLSASFAHADMRSFVENNFAEIPDADLASVKSGQLPKLGADAVAGLLAYWAAKVPSAQSSGRKRIEEKIGSNLTEVSDKINAGLRLNVSSEQALRERLQDMIVASQLAPQVDQARQLNEQVALLENNAQSNPEEIAQVKGQLAEVRASLAQAIAQMPDASGGALSTTPESLAQLGYFKNGDSMYAEYEALLARYNSANESGSLPKLIVQLQSESKTIEAKFASKFDSQTEKFVANAEESGFFRRVVVGGLGKIGVIAVLADVSGRAYLFYGAHRDPGLSPALVGINAGIDAAKGALNKSGN